MKNFFRLFTIALVVMLLSALSAVSFRTFAAVEEKTMDISNNVIFISDGAANDDIDGDGSSPDRPLDIVEVPAYLIDERTAEDGTVYGHYYYNTALYQAAEKLANTGGTIVICGDVKLGAGQSYGTSSTNKDFIMPLSDKNLCITSVYDGVDYRKTNGAEFILESPAHINLNAPTIFEKINIHTNQTTGRVICANANRLVMGEDITYPTGLAEAQYISVAGASRYSKLNGDVDVTIKSGYYYTVCGSSWGATSNEYVNVGDIKLTIEGGTFRQEVTCGVKGNPNHKIDGDVTLNIYKDAQFGGSITITGQGGFADENNEVTINLYGAKLYSGAGNIYHAVTTSMGTSNSVNGYKASKVTLNLASASSSTIRSMSSGVTVDTLLNNLVSTIGNVGIADTKIIYPAAWASTVTASALPSNSYVLENEAVSSKGASLSVAYKNPVTGGDIAAQTIDYSKTNLAFTVSCNTSNVGKVTASYKYGSKIYHTQDVEVLNTPSVNIIGVKIKSADTTYQGLKFIAYYTNETLPAGMSIADYGVIAIPADLCPNSSALNFEDTYGMNIVGSNKVADVKTIGNRVHYAATVSSNLKPNQYNVDYHARAYLKLNYNGEELYVYSNIIERNPYDVAKTAIESGLETAETISNLQTNVIDKFDNYNVNTNYVSSTNLRNKVVQAMRDQMNLVWTPSENFYIYNDGTSGVQTDLYFEKGKYYLGIPYTNMNYSQKETFSDYIVDGVLELGLIGGIVSDTKDLEIAHNNYLNFPGSDCSTAVITSWNSVINNRMELKNLYATRYMIPGEGTGILAVGSYDVSLGNTANGLDTPTMVRTNCICSLGHYVVKNSNTDKVKAGYSALQPGDAIVRYAAGSGGHARMVVSVDSNKQTVTTIECANWNTSKFEETSTGSNTYYASWKEVTYTYSDLICTGYIPITIPELVTGCSDSEYTYVTDLNLEEDLAAGKLSGKAISNRQVISVDITMTNVTDGGAVKTIKFRPPVSSKYSDVHVPSVDLSQLDLSEFNLTSGKTYTMSLDIRVAGLTDAFPTVKLIKDYKFTVK